MPTTFDSICGDAKRKFTVTDFYPSTFISGTGTSVTRNETTWGNVNSADAFTRAIAKQSEIDNTYRNITITIPASNNQQSQTKTINLFSILKILKSVNNQEERYRDPATSYWSSRNIADLDTTTLRALYDKLKTTTIPGKASGDYIIKTIEFTQDGNTRYSVSLDFLYSLKYEYCYWTQILKVLLTNLFSVDTTLTEVKRLFMNAAASVNQRLNDISAIITYISTQQETELKSKIDEINNAVTSITTSQSSINSAVNALSNKDSLSKLRSRMVEYNDEKNNYASTLLSLYGFANLVALGLLFYIYKS